MNSIGDDKDYEVKVHLKAETKQAENDVREFNKKTQRLGSLATQGEYQQKGVLSNKQVEMYRAILKEMEDLHTRQQQRLIKAEQRYSRELEQEQKKRVQKLERLRGEVEKNQSNYDRVSGSLRGAGIDGSSGQASPNIVSYHEAKLSDSIKNYEDYQSRIGSDELPKSLEELGSQLNGLKTAMEKMDVNSIMATSYQGRINELGVQPDSGLYGSSYRALSQMTGSLGLMLGIGSYMNYTKDGMSTLRSQEQQANRVTQKLGLNSTKNADSDYRDESVALGEKLGFDATQTLGLQNILLTGGTATKEDINRDTETLQKFSRAYEVDAMSMGMGTSALQRMGALDEGEMQRFANILAGAISKSDMGGREEEMLRATMSLATSMSRGLSELTSKQLMEGIGMQTQLGEAVPTLKGERGTSVLSNLNDSLKGGISDQNLKLLMGKGVEFVGLQGEYNLQKEMEKGLTNENMQRLLVHGNRMFGTKDPTKNPMLSMALKQYGVSLSDYESMYDSGLLDEWEKGNFLSTGELEERGLTSVAEALKQSGNSATSQIRDVDAQSVNFKADNAKFAEEVATTSRGLFHGLPNWMKSGLMAGGAVGGNYLSGKLLGKGAKGLSKALSPKVKDVIGKFGGGSGGAGSLMDKITGKFGKGASKTASAVGDDAVEAVIKNSADDILESAVKVGANSLDDVGKGLLNSADDVAKGLLKGGSKLGKAVPVVGTIASAGIDRAFNPESSWWRTGWKTVGSVGGGALGTAGGGAIAAASGGTGSVLVPSMAVGGAVAGESAMDALYTGLFGNEDLGGDKKGLFGWLSGDKDTTDSTSNTLKVDNLEVTGATGLSPLSMEKKDNVLTPTSNEVTIRKVSEEEYRNRSEKNYNVSTVKDEPEEHLVKVVVEGGIQGMNPSNETEVKNSLVDYFTSRRLDLSSQFLRR